MDFSRTGIANLPLHYGKAPRRLFERMVKLAREITIAIVADFSAEEMITLGKKGERNEINSEGNTTRLSSLAR